MIDWVSDQPVEASWQSDNLPGELNIPIYSMLCNWTNMLLGTYWTSLGSDEQMNGWTDGRTDGWTRWNQYFPFQLRCSGGIKRVIIFNLKITIKIYNIERMSIAKRVSHSIWTSIFHIHNTEGTPSTKSACGIANSRRVDTAFTYTSGLWWEFRRVIFSTTHGTTFAGWVFPTSGTRPARQTRWSTLLLGVETPLFFVCLDSASNRRLCLFM